MTTNGKQSEPKQCSTNLSGYLTGIDPALAADETVVGMFGTVGILKQLARIPSYVSTPATLSSRVATAIDQMNEDKEMPQVLQTAFSEALWSGSAMLILSGSDDITRPSISLATNWRSYEPNSQQKSND